MEKTSEVFSSTQKCNERFGIICLLREREREIERERYRQRERERERKREREKGRE